MQINHHDNTFGDFTFDIVCPEPQKHCKCTIPTNVCFTTYYLKRKLQAFIIFKEINAWSRGQSEIYGLFFIFVATPRKKNLVVIMSWGHTLGSWKSMFD